LVPSLNGTSAAMPTGMLTSRLRSVCEPASISAIVASGQASARRPARLEPPEPAPTMM
jgi:hypothetical protein